MTNILIVDDSPVDRQLVGKLLEADSEFDLDFAVDGAEALEKMDHHAPDLVITDLMMPRVDGFELVTQSRSLYPLVPVILMTSRGSEEIAVRALQKGAASYVPKNELARELLETVHGVLEVAQRKKRQSKLMACLEGQEHRFVIPNDRDVLSPLVGYMQEAIADIGVCDEADRMRVGIALDEALVNALYHGNLGMSSKLREKDFDEYQRQAELRATLEPYKDRQIHVTATLDRDEARFTIRDEGEGFDPDSLPDPTDPANLEKVSGRGVLLIRTFMDDVQFNDLGNQITLIKRRKAEDADQQPDHNGDNS